MIMKELSIEEKAKRYDEAIERAKNFIENGDERERTIAESIFAGLMEESEGEKIRKEIISALKFANHKGVYDKHLAWLEKQGEQKSITIDINKMVSKYSHTYSHTKDGDFGLPTNCQIRAYRKGINDALNLSLDIKKQGERKSADSYCQENCRGFQETGKCFADGDCEAKREAESVDKVAPKFHEGEWITNGNYTWKIVEVKPLDYILQSQDGNIVDDTISYVDEQFHSFTIEDAKDGDVLVTVYDKRPLIYKGCLDPNHPDSPVAYCGIDSEGYFICSCVDKFNHWWTDEKVQPATKEQRDLLFQKMKEDGYEWNAEKKELKKLGQSEVTKMSDQEEIAEIPFGAKDSELQEATYYIPKGFHAEIDDDKVVIKKGEKPTAWSEEDEEYLRRAINATKDTYPMTAKWLKSLKQRIGG